jgi:hypothetical protein
MPESHFSQDGRRRLLLVALGRQRVGKTALLNTIVQYFRAAGSEIEVWNADQQNRTHSLSTFFPDASLPPDGGLADTRGWIEGKLKEQAEHGYHAVLDAGGGFTGFSALVEDVPVIEALGARGTDVIGLFCVGPEQADLDYLDSFSREQLFVPDATMIVMNAGLVLSGRSSGAAFAPIAQNAAFKAAVARGAKVAMFPALTCMAEVTDRGLTFEEAAAGKVKPGQHPMSMFDPTRVREWWTKKVPDFFDKFPPAWLPTARAASAVTAEGSGR